MKKPYYFYQDGKVSRVGFFEVYEGRRVVCRIESLCKEKEPSLFIGKLTRYLDIVSDEIDPINGHPEKENLFFRKLEDHLYGTILKLVEGHNSGVKAENER